MVHGECKRLVFSFDLPVTGATYILKKIINEDFDNDKYVSWCGVSHQKVVEFYRFYDLWLNI
mgnify:CR=1 FL=1